MQCLTPSVVRPRISQPLRCKYRCVRGWDERPTLRPGSPRARSSQGLSFELRLCSQAATRALSSTCARGVRDSRRKAAGWRFLSSSIRVAGFMPPKLGPRWGLRESVPATSSARRSSGTLAPEPMPCGSWSWPSWCAWTSARSKTETKNQRLNDPWLLRAKEK
jgi:hypothetical protein